MINKNLQILLKKSYFNSLSQQIIYEQTSLTRKIKKQKKKQLTNQYNFNFKRKNNKTNHNKIRTISTFHEIVRIQSILQKPFF